MSDCSHPSVGVPPVFPGAKEAKVDTYNPGAVRLYGRPASRHPPLGADDLKKKIREEIDKDANIRGIADIDNPVQKLIETLIEWKLNTDFVMGLIGKYMTLAAYSGDSVLALPININVPERYIKSIGVIYGYAYEGHCYTLTKPQIMFLPTDPQKIVGGTCGCDCGYVHELGYAVWEIDKLEHVVALDVRSDDLKTLVLEENMPGNRSPMAYAQTMVHASTRPRD